MKIVINDCYGGFSLSPRAVQKMAGWQGRECYFFHHNYLAGGTYVPVEMEEAGSRIFWCAFDTPVVLQEEGWYATHALDKHDVARHDPLLVRVVEELGSEVASDSCARLKIIEIPDDVDYQIEEYDGKEWVAEKHRTWE